MTEQDKNNQCQQLTVENPPTAIIAIEALQRIAAALEAIQMSHERIAEKLAPEPDAIVGTPYISKRLGCSTIWITDMVRTGKLPKSCIVTGTGNGKPWKFHRTKIEAWIKTR